MSKDGSYIDRTTGTPQRGVISPLLANIFLHVAFRKWTEKHHSGKPFVRYADDIVVHCKTDKQARYMLAMIRKRLADCKLTLHPAKTRIINMRGITKEKYPRSFDFLRFTFKPYWSKTAKGYKLLITIFINQKSRSNVLDKLRKLQLHKRRKPLEELARLLNPIIRGVINYYCKVWSSHT